MNRPLQNIVDRIVLESDHCPDVDQFRDVQRYNLAEQINFFNDGELIHDGPHSEEYHKLAEDPELAVIEQTSTL